MCFKYRLQYRNGIGAFFLIVEDNVSLILSLMLSVQYWGFLLFLKEKNVKESYNLS